MAKPKAETVAIGSPAHKSLFLRALHGDLPALRAGRAALARARRGVAAAAARGAVLAAGAAYRAARRRHRQGVLRHDRRPRAQGGDRSPGLRRGAPCRAHLRDDPHATASTSPSSRLETLPLDIETAFKDFGFGECMDSFLGFGVFKIARQSGFLPEPMFEIFDTLMYEETRHIVFFVNWMAYRQVQQRRGARWRRAAASLRFYTRALKRMVGTARTGAAANDGKDLLGDPGQRLPRRLHLPPLPRGLLRRERAAHERRRPAAAAPRVSSPPSPTIALASLRLWNRRSGRRGDAG